MAPRKSDRIGLAPHRKALARLINTAIEQHGAKDGKPWTNESFGMAVGAHESTVRSWRNPDNPVTPPMLVPILRVLYGGSADNAAPREAMRLAWYLAKGIPPPEPPPPGPRAIENARPFTDAAEIIDLAMSQPTPDNEGRLRVPFTLRVHPDRNCCVADLAVEIGVGDVLVAVESEYWQPVTGSVFRGGRHENAGRTAATGAALLAGPHDGSGRIDGEPLGEEPVLLMESKQDGDGPIVMSARVSREGFVVVPVHRDRANEPPAPLADTRKVVLDALFAGAYELDPRNRVVVARVRVGGPKKPA